MKNIYFTKVQFITHTTEKFSYLDSIRMALEGGCRWIQLRMKDASPEEICQTAQQGMELCRKYNAVLILDDHVELVTRVGADGVHLGKKDMPVPLARKQLGNQIIIGGTANTFEDVQKLCHDGADYIGCGPFRFTTTKKNLSPILGLEGYRLISSQMKAARLNLPLIAIGGITVEDIPAVMAAGADGIALSGSILRADDPVKEMQKVIRAAGGI